MVNGMFSVDERVCTAGRSVQHLDASVKPHCGDGCRQLTHRLAEIVLQRWRSGGAANFGPERHQFDSPPCPHIIHARHLGPHV